MMSGLFSRILKCTVGALLIGGSLLGSVDVIAQDQKLNLFRIGAGGVGGTYYPVSYLLASAISRPPGSRPCEDGGSCGVDNLIAVPQSSNGSVSNVRAIEQGDLESGLVQSDIAHWAYRGIGSFTGTKPMTNLRAIASLYPEQIHIVVRKDSEINSVADLRGKRVSLDEPGSGTLVEARHILEASGLTEQDLQAEYIKPSQAIEKMRLMELDAFFIVVGYPAKSISDLIESTDIELLPIEGDASQTLLANFRFFQIDTIPDGIYPGVGRTSTLGVTALWVVSASVDESTVYQILKSLWHDSARKLFDDGHRQGEAIRMINALDGVDIPLHPGAIRFYGEQNMVTKPAAG